CEKPLVLNPWNIDALEEIERETGKKVYTVLQLRLHESVIALKKLVDESAEDRVFDVNLKYITSRGNWYRYSWKGDVQKSGGIATNIGVHFFDMLTWVFGDVLENNVEFHEAGRAAGKLKLTRANVNWHLSIDENDLPEEVSEKGIRTFRSILIDDQAFEFSKGFTDLHTVCYQEVLDGKGYGLQASKRAIELVRQIRES
ncbi:MAG: Gfo/Idh/MocA family oxidoreductase, partial [Acidobacteria bacterium]|nr:Gfo/Idh/MocA family oxidoreductase [Acidobacteriota bacterium]